MIQQTKIIIIIALQVLLLLLKAPVLLALARVSIIGGGISPSLRHLTKEAMEELQAADVVLFDVLGPGEEEIRKLTAPHCELVPVGKRGGDGPGRSKQQTIDELLVSYALAYDMKQGSAERVVVRLKGGDPFVFGRARGECDALRRHNIPFKVLPGISSSLAAALLAGIPMTDPKEGATNFACFSGSDAEGKLSGSYEWWRGLRSIDTLVFLMAGKVSRIGDICTRLQSEAGKAAETPAVVVQNAGSSGEGSRPIQRVFRGTLRTLEDTLSSAVTSSGSLSPCVLIIGPTAGLDLVRGRVDTAMAEASEDACTDLNSLVFTDGRGNGKENVVPHAEKQPVETDVLRDHDSFLLDIDGVLWKGNAEIEGALPAVRRLLAEPTKRVWFVTNNSAKSRASYAKLLSEKLQSAVVTEDMIITSGWAAAQLMLRMSEAVAEKRIAYPTSRRVTKAFVIGSEGLIEELQGAGIECVTATNENTSGAMDPASFSALELDASIGTVVCGWTPNFDYRQLCYAAAYVQDLPEFNDGTLKGDIPIDGISPPSSSRCLFVATNPDVANAVGGRLMPENGAIVAAIEAATTPRKAIVAGKPSSTLVKMIIEKFGLEVSRTCMIGDRLDTDVAFANAAGISSCLVLSGVASIADLEAARGSANYPKYIMNSIAELL